MKLLLDENLAPRLARDLAGLYPGSAHIRDLGLARALDDEIWNHALRPGFAIASKDDDFRQKSFLFGPPPKVVWIARGNCSTRKLEAILRDNFERIDAFLREPGGALLALE
jgi:predicted nuclease of predicted toxin-antitoxin system